MVFSSVITSGELNENSQDILKVFFVFWFFFTRICLTWWLSGRGFKIAKLILVYRMFLLLFCFSIMEIRKWRLFMFPYVVGQLLG